MSGLLLVAAVLWFEIVAWVKWYPIYFDYGLPIFVRRAEGCRRLDDIPIEEVQRRSATAAAPPFAFQRMGPDRIAFREGGFGFLHYAPLMRGVIVQEPAEPCAKVVGYINWTPLVGVIVLCVMLRRDVRLVAPYLLGAFAILYFIQGVRFARVARHASELAGAPPPL